MRQRSFFFKAQFRKNEFIWHSRSQFFALARCKDLFALFLKAGERSLKVNAIHAFVVGKGIHQAIRLAVKRIEFLRVDILLDRPDRLTWRALREKLFNFRSDSIFHLGEIGADVGIALGEVIAAGTYHAAETVFSALHSDAISAFGTFHHTAEPAVCLCPRFRSVRCARAYPDSARTVQRKQSHDYSILQGDDTNLDPETFPVEKIKELYHLRWGIETSFRELKHIIGLSCLHGKKTDFLLQEVFARLIFYNYASLIARQVPAPQGKQINFSVAILVCKQFLKGKIRSAQIFEILSMHLSPIRPGRQYKRYQNPVSAVAFQYRLS